MTFVVTLIALLIERFFDWSHLRRWHWFTNYQKAVLQRFPGKAPYATLAITIVPLLLAVLVIQFALKGVLFGLVELLFQLAVFLYCLGPQNLWADTFACINALVHGDTQLAKDKLKKTFGVTEVQDSQSLHGQLLNQMFIAANRRVFAIVFWFMVLGPAGAVLYRAITLASAAYPTHETAPELLQSARSVESVLDWVPVRIFTCVFALGGHFVKVFSCWRKKSILSLNINETLLTECGAAALGSDDIEKTSENGLVAKNALSLLDRSFVITLVAVAIAMLLF